jgi:hypothetical protein
MVTLSVIVAKAEAIPNITWDTSPGKLGLDRRIEEEFSFNCMPQGSNDVGTVWGSKTYTSDSSICSAALHVGAIDRNGGIVTIQIMPGSEFYTGSTSNGVTTSDYSSYESSFVFVNAQTSKSQNNTSLDIPSQGILSIKFDDGTTQEINLDRVQGISVQPAKN